jgi:hypothetical protein
MISSERKLEYSVDPGGLESVITPTGDWKDPEGPYHWAAYCPELDRMRVSGWADSFAEAKIQVDDVLETYYSDLLK